MIIAKAWQQEHHLLSFPCIFNKRQLSRLDCTLLKPMYSFGK